MAIPEPVLIAIVALVTALATTFITLYVTGDREHQARLGDQRVEAAARLLDIVAELLPAENSGIPSRLSGDEATALISRLDAALIRLELVARDRTSESASNLVEAAKGYLGWHVIGRGDRATFRDPLVSARDAFIAFVRLDLDVPR